MPYTQDSLKTRLSRVKSTETSIESVSKYIIHYRKYYKLTIQAWLQVFMEVTCAKRMSILYVINHVLQEAKKVKPSLVQFFTSNLETIFKIFGEDREITDKNEKIYTKVIHVLDIWRQRKILKTSTISKYRSVFIKAKQSAEKRKKSKDGDTSYTVSSPEYTGPKVVETERKRSKSSKSSRRRQQRTPEPINHAPIEAKHEPTEPPDVKQDEKLSESPAKKKQRRISETNIIQQSTQGSSIFLDDTWMENVIEEILQVDHQYIDINSYNSINPANVNPKFFTQKMMRILKGPASLDGTARTALTQLPEELSDPNKIMKIVGEIQMEQGDSSQTNTKRLVNEKLEDVKDKVVEFKTVLETYNARLDKELSERREAGMLSFLSARERKISHKKYLTKFAEFNEKKLRIEKNRAQILDYKNNINPKLPDHHSSDLPDLSEILNFASKELNAQ